MNKFILHTENKTVTLTKEKTVKTFNRKIISVEPELFEYSIHNCAVLKLDNSFYILDLNGGIVDKVTFTGAALTIKEDNNYYIFLSELGFAVYDLSKLERLMIVDGLPDIITDIYISDNIVTFNTLDGKTYSKDL